MIPPMGHIPRLVSVEKQFSSRLYHSQVRFTQWAYKNQLFFVVDTFYWEESVKITPSGRSIRFKQRSPLWSVICLKGDLKSMYKLKGIKNKWKQSIWICNTVMLSLLTQKIKLFSMSLLKIIFNCLFGYTYIVLL